MGEEKDRIIEFLKIEADEYRRQADLCERMGDKSFGLLRLSASTIEKMIKKIKKEI